MIVGIPSTGARYDPVADAWQPLVGRERSLTQDKLLVYVDGFEADRMGG
jgi:hypothetical protein